MFTAAHYSNLSAMTYEAGGTRCIRVIYQDNDNLFVYSAETIRKPGSRALVFLLPSRAVSIARSYVAGGTYTRFIYFQLPDTTFVEYVSKDLTNWISGKLFTL